jgi:PE-PPE domain
MSQLYNEDPNAPVSFVLVGDPSNPDGGFLERFVGGSIPSFGVATPSDLFPTEIFTNEYDGFADFPRYPIDILSDLNAHLGIIFEHTAYPNGNPSNAIDLGTAAAGHTAVHPEWKPVGRSAATRLVGAGQPGLRQHHQRPGHRERPGRPHSVRVPARQGLEAGNLLAAIGDPIAADIGILPLPISLDLAVLGEALATTGYDLIGGLIP